MKVTRFIELLGVTMTVVLASTAYAQSSAAAAASDVVAPAPVSGTQKSTRKGDRKLSSDVRRTLSKTKGVVVTNIFVRARNGAITLTGSVPDSAQIGKAEETARGVPGVASVTNRLALKPENY